MEKTATALEIERLERKVDMTLDEIIKMQKKSMRKAFKSMGKPFKKTRKNASQGSVATHPAIRQENLAQSRLLHASSHFLTVKRAGFKVLHKSNDTSKTRRRNRRRIRNTSRTSKGPARNIRVLISNEFSRSLLAGGQKGGAAARLIRAPNELAAYDRGNNAQTLDSRFASLRVGRQVQYSGSHGF